MILILLGAVVVILLLSIVLQMITLRDLQAVQSRLASLQVREPESPVQKEIRFTAPVSEKDMGLLLKRHNSIEESLHALVDLSQVQAITLATRDGLVVASNYPDAQSDAATYSHLIKEGRVPEESGLKIWQINHKTGVLIGIARAKGPIEGEKWAFMNENVIKILNYWL
ncbi:MAG: hypothetical protein LUP99_05015 [Methanomicrobiales archaeon]|nr:hypothetical protein [Methanomicrobiales archaeon]